jgi:hypothetical protein
VDEEVEIPIDDEISGQKSKTNKTTSSIDDIVDESANKKEDVISMEHSDDVYAAVKHDSLIKNNMKLNENSEVAEEDDYIEDEYPDDDDEIVDQVLRAEEMEYEDDIIEDDYAFEDD